MTCINDDEEMREVADDLRELDDGWWTRPDECKEYLVWFHEIALDMLAVATRKPDYNDDSSLVDALFYRTCFEGLMEDVTGITGDFSCFGKTHIEDTRRIGAVLHLLFDMCCNARAAATVRCA